MFESVINFVYLPTNQGGAMGNLFFQLEQTGFFSFVLPFLMIFALTYGILNNINLFGQNSKGINVILSISVGFMALQFGFVSYFFAELFPRMGVMLSIILAGLVLMGLFFKFKNDDGSPTAAIKIFGFFIVLGIIAIVYQSLAGSFGWAVFGSGWQIGYFLERNLGSILVFALLIGAILAIAFGGSKDKDSLLGHMAKRRI